MINKVANFINKYFDIRLLVLIFGALLIIPSTIVTSLFTGGASTDNISFPVWLGFVFVILSFLFVSYFIVSSLIKNNNKRSFVPLLIIFLFIIFNAITTFIEPEVITSHIYSFRLTYYVDIVTKIELTTKFIYVLQFSTLLLYVYAGIFVMPKMFKRVDSLKYVVDVFLFVILVAIIYSLFSEFDKYTELLQKLFTFTANSETYNNCSLASFFFHKNVFGLFLMLGTACCLFNFSVTGKKYYAVLSIITALYLVLTYSKSSIILTWSLLIVYFYLYNIFTFNQNKKTKTILLTTVSVIIIAFIITSLLLYSFNNSYKEMIDNIINNFGTYGTRKLLWENVLEIITPSWMATGRGFGIVETIIPEVSYVSFVERLPHEHSWFYSMLAKGGVVLVVAFITLLIYGLYVSYLACKKNIKTGLIIVLTIIVFFLQSFIENNYYVIFVLIAVSNIVLNIEDEKHESGGSNMKVLINGKFLCQKITGVQRFAIETIKELDKIIPNDWEVNIICPAEENVCNPIELNNIKIVNIKGKPNYYWEQWILPRYVKKQKPDRFLNLCNVAPILYPGSCVVHDLGCIDASNGFSSKQNLIYRFINKRNIKRYRNVYTVSNVMKNRIEEYYKISGVIVLYNSADHIKIIVPKKPDIDLKDNYYFSLGSMNPNKNFKAILRLAELNKDKTFYISGKKAKSFNNEEFICPENVIFCGYLSDEEIVYLYKNCDAFLFPTKYEGFGIPPLEALVSGCKLVICNDIPVLREIYSDMCVFVDFDTIEKLDYKNKLAPFVDNKHWSDTANKLLKSLY